MPKTDIAYYRERLNAERALAEAATEKGVAAVHEALAREYQRRIEQCHEQPTLRIVSPE
ncbi:MAG: hypothetical protein V4696_03415 [Pseudomonadota bacterium]